MPETLTNEPHKHAKPETWDFSVESRVGRRRKTGRGIMALLSRMHRFGMHGRHINHSKEQHVATVSQKPELAAPQQHRALSGAEAVPQAQLAVREVQAPARGRASVETSMRLVEENTNEHAFVPEASNIRPEIPVAALPAVEQPSEYEGRHRQPQKRPETLEQSDAMLARNDGIMPLEQRIPGSRFDQAEDMGLATQRELDEQKIVPHDVTGYEQHLPKFDTLKPEPKDAQEEPNWFDGSNKNRS